ncbi:MAG: SOS response-associated peptidase [Fimbriimonadaceae bacterium]
MCARYTLKVGAQTVLDLFELSSYPDVPVRLNVCPTDSMPVVVQNRIGEREVRIMRWGLVPSWAKDIKVGTQMINARSETIFEKPSFRSAIDRRRCLIPADGFYEWKEIYEEHTDLFGEAKKGKPKKKPYHITVQTQPLFAFAGIYEKWSNPADGGLIHTFSVITCPPNRLVETLHDRMPVILRWEDHGMWLDKKLDDKQALVAMMTPYPAEEMKMEPVGPLTGLI